MATITEDYVSFETAKLLKEKGFNDIDCEGWIGRSGRHYSADDTFYNKKELKKAQEDRKDFIPLITPQMAMKWLREVHNIVVEPFIREDTKYAWYIYRIETTFFDKKYLVFCCGSKNNKYDTYEQACEAAIKYCLENIIQK